MGPAGELEVDTLKTWIDTEGKKKTLLFLLVHHPIRPLQVRKMPRPYTKPIYRRRPEPLRPDRPPGRHMVASPCVPSTFTGCRADDDDSTSEDESGGSRDTEIGAGDSENESGGSRDTEAGADDPENASGNASATDWIFNEGLELVLHDLTRCGMCNGFALHLSEANVRPHPTYRWARLSRTVAIARELDDQISNRRSEVMAIETTISRLRRTLEVVRQEVNAARDGLKGCRIKLEEVRHELKEARQDQAAAGGSHTTVPKSRSPSPRRHGLEEARQNRAAASGSHTTVPKSSQCPRSSRSPSPRVRKSRFYVAAPGGKSSQRPRSSRSPSPRPHKSPRHAATSSTVSKFASGSNLRLQ